MDDPGASDDYDFLGDPHEGGEEELLFDDPNKGKERVVRTMRKRMMRMRFKW